MKAYLNDNTIKEKYIARVTAHYKADEIIKGIYWQEGKGCAVGCTIEGSDHSRYETELGIPRAIARFEDRIFEGLPNDEAKEFPLKFLNAVNVGADLSLVVPKFFVWLLSDPKDGVITFVPKGYKKCEKAIKQVAKLYSEVVGGKVVKQSRWISAKNAAYDAAAYAAYAAAYDADAYAAYAAADAYAYAYADADAARRTARENHYSKMANKLLELLKDSK